MTFTQMNLYSSTCTLIYLQVETRGCLLLTLEVSRLKGLEECGIATSSDEHLLRLLTPIAKLYTAKQVGEDRFTATKLHNVFLQAVSVTSEGLESFGGQGYIEDTGLPTFLRDAQVNYCSLWPYSGDAQVNYCSLWPYSWMHR